MANIAVLNGPNLNLLGQREPSIYGAETLQTLEDSLRASAPAGVSIRTFQTNHEGAMLEHIHQLFSDRVDGVIINPAAWTHTSVAIRDALAALACPFVEVHISNVHRREAFRHHSYFSDLAIAVIAGCGFNGYHFALTTLLSHLKDE